MLRNSVATESIYGFAHMAQQAKVSPEEPILEIPVSEFQGLLNELTTTYNMVAEMVRDSAILRGRELARMTTEASNSIKTTQSTRRDGASSQCPFKEAFGESQRSPKDTAITRSRKGDPSLHQDHGKSRTDY